MTGGYLGLHGITRPFDVLDSDLNFYYVAFGVFLVSGLAHVSLGAFALWPYFARHQGQ